MKTKKITIVVDSDLEIEVAVALTIVAGERQYLMIRATFGHLHWTEVAAAAAVKRVPEQNGSHSAKYKFAIALKNVH